MLTDFLLASLHHLAAFALVAIVACELVLLRPGIDGAAAKRLGMLDGFYGLAALVLLIVGFARVFFGAKGGTIISGASRSGPRSRSSSGSAFCRSCRPCGSWLGGAGSRGIRPGRRWMPTCVRPSAISMSRPGFWSCFRSSRPPWRGAIDR